MIDIILELADPSFSYTLGGFLEKLIIGLLVFVTTMTGFTAQAKPKKVTKTVVTTVEEVEEDGKDSPQPEESDKNTPKIIKNDNFIVEDSSQYNRMNKKYAAWAQLLGYGPNRTNSTGLAFGSYYTRNDILFAEITYGTGNSSGGFGSEYDIVTHSLGVHWKHFVGNSFYLNSGIDFRKVDYNYKNTSTSTDSHFDSTSTAISFAIGNQWQWQSFTLGCDWVGLSVPITHNVSNANITTSSSYEESSFNDDKDDFSKKTTGQLLRFYLGASF